MMVSPGDYKPIELTPVPALLTPRPQSSGLGQSGQATPAAPTATP
jgi:hypothetical protein